MLKFPPMMWVEFSKESKKVKEKNKNKTKMNKKFLNKI